MNARRGYYRLSLLSLKASHPTCAHSLSTPNMRVWWDQYGPQSSSSPTLCALCLGALTSLLFGGSFIGPLLLAIYTRTYGDSRIWIAGGSYKLRSGRWIHMFRWQYLYILRYTFNAIIIESPKNKKSFSISKNWCYRLKPWTQLQCSKLHISVSTLQCSVLIVWRTDLHMVSVVPYCALTRKDTVSF